MQATDFFDQLTLTVGPPAMLSCQDVTTQYSVSTLSPSTLKHQATICDSDMTSPAHAVSEQSILGSLAPP